MTKVRESLEKYEELSEILLKKNTYVCKQVGAGAWPLRRLKTVPSIWKENYKEPRASQNQNRRERHQKLTIANE